MKINQKGFSLVEVTIALGVLGGILYGLMQFATFSEKETRQATEDIQLKINELGAERFMLTDVLNSFPGFNFLNVKDDNNKWFYAFDPEFVCEEVGCERSVKLEIPPGQTESEKFYMLILKGASNEMLELNFDPESSLSNTGIYTQMNDASNVSTNISKTGVPSSPWEAGRLMLLSSNIRLFDCFSGLISDRRTCSVSCVDQGTCNKSIKRKIKILGVVDSAEEEISSLVGASSDSLLKKRFRGARQDKSGNFVAFFSIFADNSPSVKKFFENLPYVPGLNNNVYAQPVELVRYFIKSFGDKKNNRLIRQKATFVGNLPSFSNGFNVFIGAQSVEFKRSSSSSASIKFKINRVNRYND